MEGTRPPWAGGRRFGDPSGSNFPYMNPVASRGMEGSFSMVGRFPMGMDRGFYGNGSYPGDMQDIRQQFLRHQRPDMRFPVQGNNGYPQANNNGWDAASAHQQALYGPFGTSLPGHSGASGITRGPFPEKTFPGNSMNDSPYMPAQSRETTNSVNRDMSLMSPGQKYPPTNQTLISPQKDNINNSDSQRLNQIKDIPDRSRKRQKNKQSVTDLNVTEDIEIPNDSKKCGVCGGAARSMHFGGMACDSCKAFFRRSVQSGVFKNFKCLEEQKCPVAKGNRKGCQFCRFQKCKTNGMEVKWVMSETDRMQMWKGRLAKQRQVTEEKEKEIELEGLPPSLNPDVTENIKYLTKLQEDTFSSLPYTEECWERGTVENLSNTFVCIRQKLGTFFSKVEDFQKLCKNDQRLLLNSGISMSIYLHGAHMFEEDNKYRPPVQFKEAFSVILVNMEMVKDMTGLPELYKATKKFFHKYQHELKDKVILVLLSLISFYQSDSPHFTDPKAVQNTQEKYLEHLQHYLKCKEGPTSDRVLFPKLLVGLADVREVAEYHNQVSFPKLLDSLEDVNGIEENHITVDLKHSNNQTEKQQLNGYRHALTALSNLFLDSINGEYSEFSSILTPEEKHMKCWRGKNDSTIKQEFNMKGKDLSHPYTSIIFGTSVRTDLPLNNPLVELDRCIKDGKIDLRRCPRLDFSHTSTKTKTTEPIAIEAQKSDNKDDFDFFELVSASFEAENPPCKVSPKTISPNRLDLREDTLTSNFQEKEPHTDRNYGKESCLSEAYSPEPCSPPQSSQIHHIKESIPSPESYPFPHCQYKQYDQEQNNFKSQEQDTYWHQISNHYSAVDSPASNESSSSSPSSYSHSSTGELSPEVSRGNTFPLTRDCNHLSQHKYNHLTSREYSPVLCTEYRQPETSSCRLKKKSDSSGQFNSNKEFSKINTKFNLDCGMQKKKVVQSLCDDLKLISCTEDREVISSLKEFLTPEVILKVSETLNSQAYDN